MKVALRPHATMPGWYTLDYRPNGTKGKREREHCDSYELAIARKEALEGRTVRKEAATHPRLRDVVGEYLAWSKKNQAEATYEGKRCRMERHIIPGLGERRVKELTQRLLDIYGADMAMGSYRQDIIDLQAMIRWMVKRRYAEPLTFKPEIPVYRAKVKHLPPAEDILRFIAALKSEMHQAVCRLMLYTGLRWNEARSLRWEDYRGGEILARITKTDTPEIIAIPAVCIAWFDAHKQLTGYVFSATKGKTPLCNLERPVRAAFEATGVYMTAHMFRHASATFLYELTGDIYAVQHHLRHSKVTTSQIYTRYSAAQRRGSVNVLAGMLDNIVDKMDKGKNGK